MIIFGIYGAVDWDANSHHSDHSDSNYSDWVHDSGATLFIDGNHICSISEERLTRNKYEGNFPINSIEYCLSFSSVKKEDVDLVVFPDVPSKTFKKKIDDKTLHKKIKEIFPNSELKIISHHLSHAASSIFTSEFEQGNFITMDGAGSLLFDDNDGNTFFVEHCTVGYFNKKNKIINLYPSLPYTNTFGNYYRVKAVIAYDKKIKAFSKEFEINTTKQSDKLYSLRESVSGKIMGLSAYGKVSGKKDYFFSKDYSLPYIMFKDCDLKSLILESINRSAEDLSADLQKNFEESICNLLNELKKRKYLQENVCFSGGCFLNVLLNSLILNKKIFKNKPHIPPFTNDCGLSYGAACYGAFLNDENIKIPDNLALLGKKYNNDEIEILLKKYNLKFEKYNNFDDLCVDTSNYLFSNKIIGWFQNRSEFGPRALGSRSILMNPKFKENKDILNLRIKHREYWRPFAGIMLEEYLNDYFEEDYLSPYMLYSLTVKEEKIREIEAITHVDKTCRIQTVNSKLNSKITLLLDKFNKISQTPILLNTSFNDNGEPIVETPEDAIKTFLKIDLDYLVIGNFIVKK